MKNALLLCLCMFICNNVFAQSKIHLESDELNTRFFESNHFPKVTGKISHFDAKKEKDLVVDYTLVLPLQKSQKSKIANINADGSFILELESGLPYQQLWVRIGKYYYG